MRPGVKLHLKFFIKNAVVLSIKHNEPFLSQHYMNLLKNYGLYQKATRSSKKTKVLGLTSGNEKLGMNMKKYFI